MRDDRVRDTAIIRVEHADHDDEFQMESVTIDDAILAAYERVVETWDDNAAENAGTDGFPAYGITIELYDNNSVSTSVTASCGPENLYWIGDENDEKPLAGQWTVDGGIIAYDYEL